jgi:hypothetical protein
MKAPQAKKTLADLRAIHDRNVVVPNKIKAALAKMVESGDEFAYEKDFMQLCQPPMSQIDISQYRDNFSDFWATLPSLSGKSTPRRVWFATKKLADAWRGTQGG